MKKLSAILLAALLTLGLLSGCAAPDTTDEPDVSAAPAATDAPAEPDYAALYAEQVGKIEEAGRAYPRDTVVATIGAQPLTWGQFYYHLSSSLYEFVYYTLQLPADFNEPLYEGATMGEYFLDNARLNAANFVVAHEKAAELGIGLTEEDQTVIENYIAGLEENYGGKEGLQTAFEEAGIDESYMRYLLEGMQYFTSLQNETVGAQGEKLTDEEVLAWAAEKGYVRAKHILWATIDLATYTALDEAAVAEKRASAPFQRVADALLRELGRIPGAPCELRREGVVPGEVPCVPSGDLLPAVMPSGCQSKDGLHLMISLDR